MYDPSSFSAMQVTRLLKSGERNRSTIEYEQPATQRVLSEEGTEFYLIKHNSQSKNNNKVKSNKEEIVIMEEEEVEIPLLNKSAKRKLELSPQISNTSSKSIEIVLRKSPSKPEEPLFDPSMFDDSFLDLPALVDSNHSKREISAKPPVVNLVENQEVEEEVIISKDSTSKAEIIIEDDELMEEEEEEQIIEIFDDEEGPSSVLQINANDPHKQMEAEAIRLLNQRQYEVQSVLGEMFIDMQRLLEMFGVPYILSPEEAEAQCAELSRLKLVDGIITDDSDIFLVKTNRCFFFWKSIFFFEQFGGDFVYKNAFSHDKDVEYYTMQNIKRDVGLEREDMIKLALLMGCDYTDGVHGIGMVHAMEILELFPGNTGLQDFVKWLQGDEAFKDHPANQRLVILNGKKK